MKIGIDLDEVVVNFLPDFLNFYNFKTGKTVLFEDFSSYNFWEIFGGTREEAISLVYEFYDTNSFNNIGLVDGADEAIKALSEGNDLFFITSRPRRIKSQTEDFLKKYFSDVSFEVVYSGDFFEGNGKSKAEICEELGIDYFVEDNKDYAFKCAEKEVSVFLLNKPWNQSERLHHKIKRVDNWKNILEAIRNEH
ncbi:MAG: hypothetical protein ABIG28_01575 [archaeon]